jgi:hypothetical protein
MDMGMENHRLTPRMQCCNDSGFASDMSCIEKEFIERISDAGEKKISHDFCIHKPYIAQFMGHSENHMIMTASEDSFFLFFKPLFYTNPVALRAEAVTA